MNLIVVGCGTVGSTLLNLLALKSVEYPLNYKKIVLIDPDFEKSNYDLYPKVYSLHDKMVDINPRLKIDTYVSSFSGCYDTIIENYNKKESVFIDCRDSEDSSSLFLYKISSDGPYGKIIKYPKDFIGMPQNYSVSNSPYYSILTVSKVIEEILNIKEIESFEDKESKILICNHLISI